MHCELPTTFGSVKVGDRRLGKRELTTKVQGVLVYVEAPHMAISRMTLCFSMHLCVDLHGEDGKQLEQ